MEINSVNPFLASPETNFLFPLQILQLKCFEQAIYGASLGSISETSFSASSYADSLICSSEINLMSLHIWNSASLTSSIVIPDNLEILE